MRMYISVILALLAILSTSCVTGLSVTPTIPPKQPEPRQPLVEGQLSGLPDNVPVTIHVRTLVGQEVLWGKQQGSGSWEAVVTEAGGVDYTVTAEAAGFISEPISYTIHLSGTTAYLVREGQVTTQEASNLDFQFVPEHSP